MPKIKLEGMEKLQVKLKKNVQMSDVKRVVKENGKSLQEAAQRKAPVDPGRRSYGRGRADSRVRSIRGVWNPLYECAAIHAAFLHGSEREVQIRSEKAYEVTSWIHNRNYSARCFWN